MLNILIFQKVNVVWKSTTKFGKNMQRYGMVMSLFYVVIL